jgi:glycosyltransferase involved in cell wall biosynthesis
VIASAVTSLPEICGDAALLADPDSISAIADAMKIISADEQTRKVLTEKGRERAENFSWDKTAGLLWQSIEKTLTET